MMQKYSFSDFLPLIIIFTIIITLTAFRQWYQGPNLMDSMFDFMGFFFLIFGVFKIINLPHFVEAYRTYDLISQSIDLYAWIYPFIEIALGLCFLFRFHTYLASWITLILMMAGSIGVTKELMKKSEIICACLGAVFKIPMTYVTLAEDLLMGVMALVMIALA